MRDRKRRIATGLVIGLAFLCIACGKETDENAVSSEETSTAASIADNETKEVVEADSEIGMQETTTEEAEKDEAAEEYVSTWTLDGNYIDDAGNHLVMYRTYEKYGYSKDGWGAMFLPGNDIYTGELDEVDGKLTGTLYTYADDGTQTDGMLVSLTDVGGSILFQKENGIERTFLPDSTDYSDPNFLPMFSYNQIFEDLGFDPLEEAAYDYLSYDYTNDYDVTNAIIPYVEIVEVDETNPKDVLLYGDYYAWEFKKDGDVLIAVAGGHCPGIIHLERSGEDDGASYTPTGEMDEAFTDEDTKTLFGKYFERYHEISSDEKTREPKIAQVISDYAAANNLDVTKYRFGAEAAKELPKSRIDR